MFYDVTTVQFIFVIGVIGAFTIGFISGKRYARQVPK